MRNRALGYAIAGGLLIGVSILSAYMARSRAAAAVAAGFPRVSLDFTLKDASGADVSLASFRGRPLLVNFWGTWCGPCVLETPELVELSNEYRDRGLVIVGIAYNDTPADVRKFAEKFGVKYPLLMWTDEVMDAFGVTDGFPTTVFVYPDGRVAARQVGLATKEAFQRKIEALISGENLTARGPE